MHSVIPAIRGNSVIRSAIDPQCLFWWQGAIRLEPIDFEIVTFLWCRSLLIGRRPHHRTCLALSCAQEGSVIVTLRFVPKILARSAAERIVGFCYRGNGNDSTFDLFPTDLFQHTLGNVLLVPSG